MWIAYIYPERRPSGFSEDGVTALPRDSPKSGWRGYAEETGSCVRSDLLGIHPAGWACQRQTLELCLVVCMKVHVSEGGGAWLEDGRQVNRVTEKGAQDDGIKWYAVHTRSNFEARCEEELRLKGLEPYLPAFEEVHDWKDRRAKVRVPLFPNYVFARLANTAETRVQVLQTAGVVRILGTGNQIEPVPDIELDAIRRLLAAGRKCQGHPGLLPGTRVTVISGPLRGVEGTLIKIRNETRLQCSVELLGRSVSVEIDTRDLRPSSAAGTRGGMSPARPYRH